MKADISRNTFRPSSHFSSVLMQQGRVLLDADFNEQAALLLHYMRALATDMIGPNEGDTRFKHGGPGSSFKIVAATDENNNNMITISRGHYYVNGILCENNNPNGVYYDKQINWPLPADKQQFENGNYLVFLDVWERLITTIEDDYIREVALGDPDTCARAQIIWQVKTLPFAVETAAKTVRPAATKGSAKTASKSTRASAQAIAAPPTSLMGIAGALDYLSSQHSTAQLAARPRPGIAEPEPCITPPDSRYRGAENQLYRVEIHTRGTDVATFKWSRDNGSVTFPIESSESADGQSVVQLKHLGRDMRSTLELGDWVEAIDDILALREEPGSLLMVTNVDHDNLNVTLKGTVNIQTDQHPLLRRWDYRDFGDDVTQASDNALKVEEGKWITLEDGIQILFDPSEVTDDSTGTTTDRVYFSGDYWLIPARVATGTIEWPEIADPTDPSKQIWARLPALGVAHHYAPLGTVTVASGSFEVAENYTDAQGNAIPLRRSLSSIPLILPIT